MRIEKKVKTKGFTLIELLVVIAIIGILATVAIASFRSSQIKARDAQRKSDLKAIASALELYYNDYGSYPLASHDMIVACSGNPCKWGAEVSMTDGKTIYLKTIPQDPSGVSYVYRTVDVGGANQGFQIYAELENKLDTKSCIGGDCESGIILPGGYARNFAITSPNVTATAGFTQPPPSGSSDDVIPTITPSLAPSVAPTSSIIPTYGPVDPSTDSSW